MAYSGHIASKAVLDLNGLRIYFQKHIDDPSLRIHFDAREILNTFEGDVVLPLNDLNILPETEQKLTYCLIDVASGLVCLTALKIEPGV